VSKKEKTRAENNDDEKLDEEFNKMVRLENFLNDPVS